MAIVKLYVVLLLCMLVMRQCIPCEASRKMLTEGEAEGMRGYWSMSRKILSEEGGEDANDMEAELMLPDENENEKFDIELQEPSKKLEKRHKEDEEESGNGGLPLEGSQDEKAAEEKAQKKKEKKKDELGVAKEASLEQDSTGQSTVENLQEDGEEEKKKARNDMEGLLFTSQTLEEDPSFEMEKGDQVESVLGEASLSNTAETESETRGGAFLSEVGEEEDGGNTFKKKLQTEEQSSKDSADVFISNEHQANIDDTKQYKGDAKEKSLKPKKSKQEKVEGAVKTQKKKADMDGVSKSEVQDDRAERGDAVVEEITDDVMPADVIEREMQGKREGSVIQAVEEEKTVEDKQQESNNAKKKTPKKPKSPKQSKLDIQVSEEEDAESKRSTSIDDKDMKTKVKQKEKSANSNSPSKLQGDPVVEAGENSDSQLKQAEAQDKAKRKAKKKKAKSSEKPKEEEKSSEKHEKDELLRNDNEAEKGTKDSVSTEFKADKKLPKSESLGNADIDASAGEDTSKKKQSQVEEPSKGTEDELPTIEKQEEKFDVEVQSIAEEAQERAEGSDSATRSLSSSVQGVDDDDDDEYGDFLQDFTDFSTKFQDTALKVADHIGPNIQKITDTSKVYFNKANQQITESFSPLVGKQFAPFLASLISYGLLLVPLAVVIMLFEHIRALLSLQKVLLFVNIYLAAYFATLLLATFIMGEPMNYFFKSSASGYVHLQLLQALAYIIYLILQTFDLVFTCTSETLPVKVTVALQWLVAFTVGFHYYVTIFHRAMALKGPHTNWKIYGIYSIAFLVLCLFARIKRVKKGYSQIGQNDTDKKH